MKLRKLLLALSLACLLGSVLLWSQGGSVVVGASTGNIMSGFCNSTIGTGAATTYILVPFFNGTGGPVCTITGVQEQPVPVSCSATSLYVTAGAGGAVAGSGVVEVYKGGVASGLKCTLGTGTSCNDTTHTVTFAAGNVYSIRVTTGQATDTTATVRASFKCV